MVEFEPRAKSAKSIVTFNSLSSLSKSILFPYIKHWGILSYEHYQESELLKQDINSPLPYVRLNGKNIGAQYAITYAILLDDHGLLDELIGYGADFNCKDGFNENKTPLDLAYEYGRLEIAKTLISKGAKTTNACVMPEVSLLRNPIGFMWVMSELLKCRQVDYLGIECELPSPDKLRAS